MTFNLDRNKQAEEIILNRKKTVSLHPVVHLVNTPVKSTQIHKHLRIMFDSNLSYGTISSLFFKRLSYFICI